MPEEGTTAELKPKVPIHCEKKRDKETNAIKQTKYFYPFPYLSMHMQSMFLHAICLSMGESKKAISKKQKARRKEAKSSTTRSQEVSQPSTDEARDCLISRFGVDLDVSSRVWPLRLNLLLSLFLINFLFVLQDKSVHFVFTSN